MLEMHENIDNDGGEVEINGECIGDVSGGGEMRLRC